MKSGSDDAEKPARKISLQEQLRIRGPEKQVGVVRVCAWTKDGEGWRAERRVDEGS